MKAYHFFLVVLLLAACHSAIKHDDKTGLNTVQTIAVATQVPVPDANNNLAVNAPEDLIGYWVGMFDPDMNYDSLDKKMVTYGENYWNRSNKINVSIDSINGNSVTGHSVDAGTQQSFKGSWKLENGSYQLSLKEPGTNKYDGTFTMSIPKNDTLLSGTWVAFGKIDIPKRKYQLQKKFFRYNPDWELENSRFGDWEKSIKNKPPKNIDDDPEYYDKSYFATTEDVMKYNASTQLLTEKEVSNLKKGDLFIIRNSIYARHGFSFKNRPLRAFFDKQDWYVPIYTDIKKDFTDMEKKNIELLLRYEKNARAYYDVFGRG